MSTDYRALCAELLQTADTLLGQGESPANPGERLILTVHLEALEDCANRARAALSQPEPVAPTDEELWEMYELQRGEPGDWSWVRDYARTVLARWGTPANTINQEDYDRG
jgi:hypothetical protein